MKINKHLIKNLDWFLPAMAVIITLVGIMTIFSATRPPDGGQHPSYFMKQAYWLLLGLLAMSAIVSFDYIWLGRAAYVLYVVGILLLAAVLIGGRSGMGAQRWLSLGPLSFQPSELFKLFFVIAFARYMATLKSPLKGTDIIKAFLMFAALPFAMLVKQPDLGTAVVLFSLFIALVLTKGVGRKVFAFIIIAGIISIPFLGNILWGELKDYQKNRIVAFMEPAVDPAGVGYHIIQSKVAIGSGGFWGKGYLKGTQGPFRFLPEKHTDFIFSVFAEEHGLAGCILLLMAYLALIYRAVDTARKAKDEFGRFLALGITFMLTAYTVINIAMTMGLMPIVGIPLPFMSYGGTALLGNFMAVGILMNIRARRFELFY
ncbi:MAG: rod shape-determining protein RodA [Thermodesulfovibrionales bacterium]|nr:rod shape-determining protein RodA [Thermodesulfovibrionales bacterium]